MRNATKATRASLHNSGGGVSINTYVSPPPTNMFAYDCCCCSGFYNSESVIQDAYTFIAPLLRTDDGKHLRSSSFWNEKTHRQIHVLNYMCLLRCVSFDGWVSAIFAHVTRRCYKFSIQILAKISDENVFFLANLLIK